ncbi:MULTISPECIES: hypothetical protein [Bacillus]|uniref:hypothetical protein n=1 Tax=Bacillus TaxID=1386 RepID=UPI00228147E1|nr:hypothetical protein [Bacillus haynesii]MCY7801881.1 hypothetical protein [Bacillus haynesii]MCY8091983.1 hypothetical protein [Bacillus haynesii]MCY8290850.1 hypothetical protein [Bacillus haynesii]MCY8410638.1 hypothetical protein [Bacillus haynesii]MCY8432575.1 hypothetical protein [Bacillus haynesii]
MKSLIINHLFEGLNKEIDAEWWAKYVDLLVEFTEERNSQTQDSSTASSESDTDVSESVDESLKPLIAELKDIFEDMNSSILENNNKVLKDILGAAAQGIDRNVLEEIIESVRKEVRVSDPETTESLETFKESTDNNTVTSSTESLERSVVETLTESLPEDHTIPSPETVKVLKAVQENRNESENN